MNSGGNIKNTGINLMKIDSFAKYLIKYVLIAYAVLAVFALIFSDDRLLMIAGLSIGTAMSILKLTNQIFVLKSLLPENSSKPVRKILLRNFLNYLSTFILLAATAIYSPWLFAGTAAGVLTVPLIMTVYSFGRGFGFIHR